MTDTADGCPGCDGTIIRALGRGRDITTWKRCGRCAEGEADLMERFGDVIADGVVTPPMVVRRFTGSEDPTNRRAFH